MSNVGYLREILPTSKPSFDRKLMIYETPSINWVAIFASAVCAFIRIHDAYFISHASLIVKTSD